MHVKNSKKSKEAGAYARVASRQGRRWVAPLSELRACRQKQDSMEDIATKVVEKEQACPNGIVHRKRPYIRCEVSRC